jgi:CRISPR-associated protein Cas2
MENEQRALEGRRPKRKFVVVCYDIPKDRRRNRVCKLLKNYGERAQYSVFECLLRPKDLRRLRQQLKPLIVPQ